MICLDTVTPSLQSPVLRATQELASPQAPWISWHMAFPAGFKGTPGRGAPQSMKRTAWLPQRAFDQRARRCLGNHLALCLLVDETEAQREEGTGLPLAHSVPLCK